MRVIHVITRLVLGGAQENTIASVIGLRTKPGLEVELLSGPAEGPEGSLESQLRNPPGVLTIVPDLVRPIHPWKDALAWKRLATEFRLRRPHLVHTHSGKAGFLGRLAAARSKVPVIVHTIHGPSFGNFQGDLANLTFRTAEKIAGRRTTHFVSVSDAMTRQYLAAGIGKPEQFTTIRSGFVLEPFLRATNDPTLRAKLGIGPEDLVVGTIARLFKLKGHDELINLAPLLLRHDGRIKFLLVGDGAWRGRLEERVKSAGLEKQFFFAGLVPPAEIPRYTGIMDVLVHLSRREGLARALPMALAAGKPVVAYDCDGAGEVCRDGETGFLVKPGDLSELLNRLGRLVTDATVRNKFGMRGRELVRDQFGLQRMVDDLHGLYLRLAREHGITQA